MQLLMYVELKITEVYLFDKCVVCVGGGGGRGRGWWEEGVQVIVHSSTHGYPVLGLALLSHIRNNTVFYTSEIVILSNRM